jgi:hypothetical protein
MEGNKRPILFTGWNEKYIDLIKKQAESNQELYISMPRHLGMRQVDDLLVYRQTYLYSTPEEDLTPLELELKKNNCNRVCLARANGKSRMSMWNTLVVCYGEKEATKMWKELEAQFNE